MFNPMDCLRYKLEDLQEDYKIALEKINDGKDKADKLYEQIELYEEAIKKLEEKK